MLKAIRRRARGANVPHRKHTQSSPTVPLPVPGQIVLLMQQHIGAPSKPVVQTGDTVRVGTLVAEAPGFVGANIYSGVSGTVTDIKKMMGAGGALVDAVVIEADGQQTVDETIKPPTVRDKQSLIEAVKACGLVGLGGAGFPTAVKLSPKEPDKIDTLIINAAECEPYITTDNREILECSDSVLTGIKAVQKHLGIPKAIIAVERNKPEAMDLLFSLTHGDADLEVRGLPTRYPQGAEKVLIETITGREVPCDGLPADIGVLVMNVTTVSTLGKYLATGMPLVTKKLTVDGSAVKEPKNVEAVIGTSVADLLAFCGAENPAKVIMGGPMMGVAMADLSYPIIKQNNAILALTEEEATLPEPKPCIRCGRCVNACPHSLSPVELNEAYERRDVDQLRALHAEVCMGCGVCSFVCPAKRRVSQNSALARLYFLKEGKR